MVDNLLYSKIISDIDNKISEGVLLPDQKLPSERQLSAHYRVSRTVVREAIKVLSEKGLVEVKVGRGTYITKPARGNVTKALQRVIHSSDSTIEDIIEVREELELATIRKAVVHAKPDGLRKLTNICRLMDDDYIKVDEFVAKDAEFHLALAELTGNKIFYLLISSFYDMTDKALFDLTHMIPADIDETRKQHWTFVRAIEQKDLPLAERTVRIHMGLIRQEVGLLKKRHQL